MTSFTRTENVNDAAQALVDECASDPCGDGQIPLRMPDQRHVARGAGEPASAPRVVEVQYETAEVSLVLRTKARDPRTIRW
jgi:hypothetical protein